MNPHEYSLGILNYDFCGSSIKITGKPELWTQERSRKSQDISLIHLLQCYYLHTGRFHRTIQPLDRTACNEDLRVHIARIGCRAKLTEQPDNLESILILGLIHSIQDEMKSDFNGVISEGQQNFL